ncbi:MAG: hypothetical protein ABJA89_12135 [Lapillicoccus sp.]
MSALTSARPSGRRPWRLLVSVVGLAVVMTLVGAVAGGVGRSQPEVAPASTAVGPAAAMADAADAGKAVTSLQDRLRQVPNDWNAWTTLGMLYVTEARLTADPSYYAKAEGAFSTSLSVRPDDNPNAATGRASLAASRHEFAQALDLTQAVDRVNPYAAANLGIMVDALVELGRYPEAFTALQRMVDLKPGVASYARVSYAYELRGDLDGAAFALQRALAVASTPGDLAFARQYLSELAFNRGDLLTAASQAETGLAAAPDNVPLLAARARVEAAQGKTADAVRDWAQVTTRLPQPTYLIEYGDLLSALGRTQEAEAQYALVGATATLFRAAGANVDLELSLFDADHGRAAPALAAAQAQVAQRQSLAVEDAYAWALHASGRDVEALAHADAADRLGMRNALFAYHRGMIEQALGHDAEAMASLQKAMDINPAFSPLQAPVARATLDALRKKVS